MSAKGYANYQENQLVTATPGKLLLIAYDGAIRFCRLAAEKMTENNLAEQSVYANKAVAIVCELMSTLKSEVEPILVSRLRSIYSYVIDKLATANMNQDHEALAEATKILCDLREAWAQADKNAQSEATESTHETRRWGSEAAA